MGDTEENIIQRVRLFWRNFSWKKCLTFFIFLLLAIIFWGMQVFREKFEDNIIIPIKYIHVPDSIIFENHLPEKVTAIVKDDGAALTRYYLTKRNDSLVIDVREAINNKKGSTKFSVPNEKMDQLIREKLYGGTDLRSYSPSYILEPFTVMQKRTVSVVYDGHIELAQGYIIDGDLTISPEEVTAYGSKQMLDTTFFVHTINDTIYNLKGSKSVIVPLRKIKGMKLSPDTIRLTIPTDRFTIEKIDVPISCINLPQDLSIKFFPSSVGVSFMVGLKQYKNIKQDDFKIILDYNELKNQKSSRIAVGITHQPDYVRVQSFDPSEIEFILEKKE